MRQRRYAVVLSGLIVVGCRGLDRDATTPMAEQREALDVVVQHFGGMREVMRDGKVEARVALGEFGQPGHYGVGALAGLAGEILIDDGELLVARDDVSAVQRAAVGEQATLLTVARVSAWQTIEVASPLDLAAIESELGRLLPESLRAGAEPVPIVIEGDATTLDMHVVRGACTHGQIAGPAPARWSVEPGRREPVRIVGFFAPGRAGVMTHHGTALHIHASRRGEQRAMGHVDDVVLAAGARIMVPAGRERAAH